MQIKIDPKIDIIYDKVSDIYKYVIAYYHIPTSELVYCGSIKGLPKQLTLSWTSKYFTTEKEAAKAVDIELIRRGLEPVNILKKL